MARTYRYLSSKFVGKLRANVVVGVRLIVDGVEGRNRVSDSDREVSDEIHTGSITKFCSPWVNEYVIQCGRRCDEVGGGGIKNTFIVGVDPKKSDGILGIICCEVFCRYGEYFKLYH